MKTSYYFNQNKNNTNLNNDNNNKEQNTVLKKYIENYKDKKNYNNKQNNVINELININHTNSNKIINPLYSNINNLNKNNLEKESSFKTISPSFKRKLQKTMDDSQIYDINQLEDKYKKKLGNNLLYKNDKISQLSNIKGFFTKRDKENIMNLTPLSIQKNRTNIQKYIHYLLSYKEISKFPNFDNNLKDKKMMNPKKKRKNSINIFKKKYHRKKKLNQEMLIMI